MVNIQRELGRRPIFAAGNTAGDREMLEYALASEGPSMALLVDHDDADREYAYEPEAVTVDFDGSFTAFGRELGLDGGQHATGLGTGLRRFVMVGDASCENVARDLDEPADRDAGPPRRLVDREQAEESFGTAIRDGGRRARRDRECARRHGGQCAGRGEPGVRALCVVRRPDRRWDLEFQPADGGHHHERGGARSGFCRVERRSGRPPGCVVPPHRNAPAS